MPLLDKPARARATFHRLRVTEVERLTDASVAVRFAVPRELWDDYRFRAGQHLTLRATIAGEEVRQSYSICERPLPATGLAVGQTLRVASAEVPGGRMSTWLNRVLQVGDEVDVLPPLGTFVLEPRAEQARHHVAIAAGSGITPVLAVLQTALADEPLSRATLLYGNRRTDTVMFLEELEDLKNAHPGRFQLVHVLSREPQDVELFSGRLDRERLTRILDTLVPTDGDTQWWLCGPLGLVTTAQDVLAERGAARDHVHHEIFHADDAPARPSAPEPVDDGAPPAAVVTVTLDGRSTDVPMRSREETVLAATLRARPDAPYSCTGGVCGTCRARLVEGEVTMDRHYALEDDEVAAGIVLTCQAHPVTDRVRLDYDA
ncbi:1,2-phenylacetyl-CoA epoxidase subunit PaaE [Lapillicoccus jejuensis]|uniref:Ring-1,2-phenylacetyl-CoA epoxidase subunit PaaE n=1 Tax=Lapillicoccus jejuensis TaxID=402171 RepID=A0A542E422_9MICO|nr:1,2-phenylacetyl-CoA epoxidase subunit PaaE [Lapillicoccus jejuensis]TQJ10039.1 ring-1,2-phenylacetyl-CoA epoxidase subunit PaaE [Lapillicoccus jejuensis]